jgi:hypothetical protein
MSWSHILFRVALIVGPILILIGSLLPKERLPAPDIRCRRGQTESVP